MISTYEELKLSRSGQKKTPIVGCFFWVLLGNVQVEHPLQLHEPS